MRREEYPSVTTVLKPFGVDIESLPPKVRAQFALGADRGTRVHAYLKGYVFGMWSPVEPDIEGYCRSGALWADRNVKRVILVEERLYDDLWCFSGQPDLVIEHTDGGIWLIDWKSSLGLNPLWKGQIRAYKHLVEKNLGITIDRAGSIRPRPDGSDALFNEIRERETDLEAFLCALKATLYFTKGGYNGSNGKSV
jgi:hypothetical protein